MMLELCTQTAHASSTHALEQLTWLKFPYECCITTDQIASNDGEFTRQELRQNIKTLTCPAGRFWSFFSMKICMACIDILLSKLGYTELVQRLFEKMTFFLMDPLLLPSVVCTPALIACVAMESASSTNSFAVVIFYGGSPCNSVLRTLPTVWFIISHTALYCVFFVALVHPSLMWQLSNSV